MPFVKPCRCFDRYQRVDALHLALRCKGFCFLVSFFYIQKVISRKEGKGFEGTTAFLWDVSKKENYKLYFYNGNVQYLHLEELECCSYLLSRHGFFVCYLHAVHYFVVIFILICVCLKKWLLLALNTLNALNCQWDIWCTRYPSRTEL